MFVSEKPRSLLSSHTQEVDSRNAAVGTTSESLCATPSEGCSEKRGISGGGGVFPVRA